MVEIVTKPKPVDALLYPADLTDPEELAEFVEDNGLALSSAGEVLFVSNVRGDAKILFPGQYLVTYPSGAKKSLWPAELEDQFTADNSPIEFLAGGVTGSAELAVDASGATNLVAGAAGARIAIVTVEVTEDFNADGEDDEPVFEIGEADSSDSLDDGSAFEGAVAGTIFQFAGPLTSNKALRVTATPGTGDATGAIRVSAVVIPAVVEPSAQD